MQILEILLLLAFFKEITPGCIFANQENKRQKKCVETINVFSYRINVLNVEIMFIKQNKMLYTLTM